MDMKEIKRIKEGTEKERGEMLLVKLENEETEMENNEKKEKSKRKKRENIGRFNLEGKKNKMEVR